jgi:hypothetical protein
LQGLGSEPLCDIRVIAPQLDIQQCQDGILVPRVSVENRPEIAPRVVVSPFPGQNDAAEHPRVAISGLRSQPLVKPVERLSTTARIASARTETMESTPARLSSAASPTGSAPGISAVQRANTPITFTR